MKSRASGRRRRPVALLACGLLFCLVAYCVVTAGRHFYYVAIDDGGTGGPTAPLLHPERTAVPGLVNVTFPSRDGTPLSGWLAPPKNGALILVTTGTDSNRSAMLPEIEMLANAGFGVLAFDWPGTGLSGGKIDWGAGAIAALEGSIDWASRRSDILPSGIGALGFSIGGMVTVRVAAVDPRLRAMVLLATPSGIGESPDWFHRAKNPIKNLPEEWAARWYGNPIGSSRPVDLIGQLAPRPVFIVCGSSDPDVDAAKCAQFFQTAGEPKELWILPASTHGHYIDAAPEEYPRRVVDFLRRRLTGGSAAPSSI